MCTPRPVFLRFSCERRRVRLILASSSGVNSRPSKSVAMASISSSVKVLSALVSLLMVAPR